MWRTELGKAREHGVILEATVVRAEEKVRVAEANAEARIKEAVQRESAATKEKQELLAYVNMLKAQLQRSVSILFSLPLARSFVNYICRLGFFTGLTCTREHTYVEYRKNKSDVSDFFLVC